jgi:ATP-binding cassette subfamily B protein
MARSSSDIAAVRVLVGFGGVSFVSTVFALVGALAAMVAVDPWLTLWAVAPYPVLVVLARWANVAIHERSQAVQDQLGVLSARVQEHLGGISVVRAYTLEARATAEFDASNREYLTRSLALARTLAHFVPITGLITGLGALIALWLGGRAVMDGHLTLGALVAFNGYLAYLAWPTMALGFTLSILRRGLTSMARIQEISADAPGEESPAPAFAGPPTLSFRGLSFAYPGRPPVLRDVSFDVGAGETIAVVGLTGSGKSTLGTLLTRLWEPPPATVFVGGRDVTGMSLGTLRGAIGYVPQEAFLFSRPLTDNVTLGRQALGPDAVRAATTTAGVAEEVARFPAGWDTVVGERGLTVSGGQRQRLALARALAGDPPILVLDDVFASVDAAKEEEIVLNLRRAAAGRTVLLMTHRLHAARAADRIVVLAEGRVAESGTHDDLMRRPGLYAQLWRIQQLEEEIARA